MLFKTRGIVISYIKYKESSIITTIFTESFGLQTYIVNSIRSQKSKNKISYFQPLTLLELVVYKNDKKNIQRISEYKSAFTYTDIPFNPQKSSIAIFISELLAKTLSSEENQTPLFDFLFSSLSYFDIANTINVKNFHLQFINHLCIHLGIYANSHEIISQIELKTGFSQQETNDCLLTLTNIQSIHYTKEINISLYQRKLVFSSLILFLQEHFITLSNIKSIDVIRETNL